MNHTSKSYSIKGHFGQRKVQKLLDSRPKAASASQPSWSGASAPTARARSSRTERARRGPSGCRAASGWLCRGLRGLSPWSLGRGGSMCDRWPHGLEDGKGFLTKSLLKRFFWVWLASAIKQQAWVKESGIISLFVRYTTDHAGHHSQYQ